MWVLGCTVRRSYCIFCVWSPVILYLKRCGSDESDRSTVGGTKVIDLLWHTASSGLPRGFLAYAPGIALVRTTVTK